MKYNLDLEWNHGRLSSLTLYTLPFSMSWFLLASCCLDSQDPLTSVTNLICQRDTNSFARTGLETYMKR